MSTNQQNKEEEVDLGSLFRAIGNMFKGLIDFIVKIFIGIFHFIIESLLFFRSNLIKFILAAVLGGAVGFYFEYQEEEVYGADMIVQPNFDSARRLYSIIGDLNNLLKEKDTAAIAKVFGITEEQASQLRGFKVKPIKTEDDKIELYYDIIKNYDTVASQNYTFSEFKTSFTDFNYKLHKIQAKATDNKIFKDLGGVIISRVIENDYYSRVKDLTLERLKRNDSIFMNNLSQIDTLRKVYLNVMLEESKKDKTGTNIDVGTTTGGLANEIELFRTNRIVVSDLDKLTTENTELSEVVNVVSDFETIGYRIGGIRNNSTIIYAAAGFVLMLAGLLLIKLNTFLVNYKKE